MADGRDAWEPRTYLVGQHVRIRLSPECPLPRKPDRVGLVEHYPEQDGLVGVVGGIDEPWAPRGHRYFVYLPTTCDPAGGLCCSGGYFAGAELEAV